LVWPPLVGLGVAVVVTQTAMDRKLVVSMKPPAGERWVATKAEASALAAPVARARGRSRACAARFDSLPSGAEVAVNGQSIGITPLDVAAVPCGPVSVTMTHSRYRTFMRTVEVVPGKLLEVTGRLRRSTNAGVRIAPAHNPPVDQVAALPP
jgi:hypothetical protein